MGFSRQEYWSGLPFPSPGEIKGFSVVNEAEVDIFLELHCFLCDPAIVGILISGSSASSKPSLHICKFSGHILRKPSLKDFERHLAIMGNEPGFGGSQIQWEVPFKEEQRTQKHGGETWQLRLERCTPSPRNAEGHEHSLGGGWEAWEQTPLWASRGNRPPLPTTWCQTPGLQNWKTIHTCCFKPSSWSLLIAAWGH